MNDNPYSSGETPSGLFPPTPITPNPIISWIVKGVLLLGMVLVVIALFLPFTRRGAGHEAARRSHCSNNLKQIALALYNYHDKYGSLPPAYTVDATGKPLHSWRTLLLPYIEEKKLYESIDLTKPWNDPVNQAAYNATPSVFYCPSTGNISQQTPYVAILAKKGSFYGSQACKFSDITDGLSNTLLMVEVDAAHSVHWMAPQDIDLNTFMEVCKTPNSQHKNHGIHVLLGDGSVRPIDSKTTPDMWLALISVAGNDNELADKARQQ